MADTAGISEGEFAGLRREYRRRWRVDLCVVDADGKILLGSPLCNERECQACEQARAFAIVEALRWGEPTVGACWRQRLLWAVPLMHNEKVVGGLVASVLRKEGVLGRTGQGASRHPPGVRGATGIRGATET